MARLDHFDPELVDDSRELVPAGVYAAQIIESEIKDTKDGFGQLINLTFEIIEGPLAKRRVWDRLNYRNRNQQAQDIGHRQLKRLCNAVGHSGLLNDTEDLHFKPLRIRVQIKPATADYGEGNEVKGYEPYAASGPPPAAAPASGQREPMRHEGTRTAAASAGSGRPWK